MSFKMLRNIAAGAAGFVLCTAGLDAQEFFFKVGGPPWKVNDPFDKEAKPDPKKATVSGQGVTLKTGNMEITRKLSDVTRIVWPQTPAAIENADIEVLRGEGANALSLIEPVVRFFTPLKKVPGSLWLRAASVKLDALVLLKNDAVIEGFLGELEEMNDGSIPGLDERIRLAKLEQLARKGKSEQALAEADKLLRDTSNLDLIAQLTLVKAGALFGLRRYEDAMNMYLRVPVFYGSRTKFIPPALLGAAKSFRAMDTPQNKYLRLEQVANKYLVEIVTQYPLSKEAEDAAALLPKAIRDSLTNKGTEGAPSGESAPADAEAPADGN